MELVKMVYKWENVLEAVEAVKAFPWKRKLKKAEHFSNACEAVKLYEKVNDTLCNPILDLYYPEKWRKYAFEVKGVTCAELDTMRKDCERVIKDTLNSLGRECLTGELDCEF